MARLLTSASYSTLQITQWFNNSGSLNKLCSHSGALLSAISASGTKKEPRFWTGTKKEEVRSPMTASGARATSTPCPPEGSPLSERVTVCNHTSRVRSVRRPRLDGDVAFGLLPYWNVLPPAKDSRVRAHLPIFKKTTGSQENPNTPFQVCAHGPGAAAHLWTGEMAQE